MITTSAGSRAGLMLCAGLLFALGLAALGLAGVMNYSVGQSLGANAEGRSLYGAAHVLVDAMAVALALGAGLLWRYRFRGVSVVVALFAVLFGAYSATSLIGYGAAHRMGVTEQAAATAKARADAAAEARRQADAAAKLRERHIAWLHGTTETKIATRDRPEERREFLAEADRAVSAHIAALAVAPAAPSGLDATILPDAATRALATLLGADPATVQLGLVLLLSTLIIAAKLVGPWLAALVWPAPAAPRAVTASPSLPQPLVSPAPAPLPVVVAPVPTVPPAKAERPNLVVLQGLGLPQRPADPLEAFLWETRKAGGGAHLLEELWTAYARFCTVEQVAPLDQNTFAKLLNAKIDADQGLSDDSQEGWHKYRSKQRNGQRLTAYVLPPLVADEVRRAA